ncbi:starch-binding domain-containing protein 1 [Amia ocellicauda]|uniref:starch-binding domain-containing protein 1 n=1 Tax=Amia ocellicauda TaxID=2972642 RepID=UPI0034640DA3
MIGGYGPSLALGIIVMLSLWAFFFIYRSLASPKSPGDENGVSVQDEVKQRPRAAGDAGATDKPKENGCQVSETQDDCSAEPREQELLQDMSSVPESDHGAGPYSSSPDKVDRLAAEEHHPSSVPDHPEYLSNGGDLSAAKIETVGAEKKPGEADVDVDAKWEKTEISIMEATMNDNEWLNENWSAIKLNLGSSDRLQEVDLEDPEGEPEDSTPVEGLMEEAKAAGILESDPVGKKVAAVQPMPQSVGVSFKVHYITHSPSQQLAVTGNHKELGSWESYVALNQDKDGFWCNSIPLPSDCELEWKFVMVEEGKVRRWEECCNRHLDTGRDDIQAHKWWGYL